MNNEFFIENYEKYVTQIFNKEMRDLDIHFYHKLISIDPNHLIKDTSAPQTETETLNFIRILYKEEIESHTSLLPVKHRVCVINGIAELMDKNGNYLLRICDNAIEADIMETYSFCLDLYDYKVIVVKDNGDLLLYNDSRSFQMTLSNNVSSAKIMNGSISVQWLNGQTGTCTFDGVCITDN